jgi:5-methyltetrahydrofolate--homocysteine methyltransferase
MDARSPQVVRAVKAADLVLNRDEWGAAWIAWHRAQLAERAQQAAAQQAREKAEAATQARPGAT